MKVNDLPDSVRVRLRGYQSDGRNLRTESCSDVYLFTHRLGRRSGLILKTRDVRLRPQEPDLLAETVALSWLRGKLPVPELLCFHVEGDMQYLVMTQLDGVTGIHQEATKDPARLVAEFARGCAKCTPGHRILSHGLAHVAVHSMGGRVIESGALDDLVPGRRGPNLSV